MGERSRFRNARRDPAGPRMRRVKRRSAGRPIGRALCALAALACQTSYYDEYRARHPEWHGEFPREGASLEEVLAGLYAPANSEDARIEVDALEIWRIEGDVAGRIDFEALRSGDLVLAAETDVVVLAPRRCHAERGLQDVGGERVGYYLLPDLRLQAYDHYAFGKACAVKNEFRAARGEAIALELAAAQRVASDYGRMPIDLVQLYRRGLAYLEAGRVREAEAVLTTGEPLFREAGARVRQGAHGDAFDEAARLRAQLMRALGVKAQTRQPPAPR